jgi:hypothetical protein
MMNLKPAICLGIALSISSSAWAAAKFECETADEQDDVSLNCYPIEEKDEVDLESSNIVELELNVDKSKRKVVIALDMPFEELQENCLFVNPTEFETNGTDAVRVCEWTPGESVVIVLGNTNQRRRVTRARCWGRSSFRWRCRWRTWYCSLIN